MVLELPLQHPEVNPDGSLCALVAVVIALAVLRGARVAFGVDSRDGFGDDRPRPTID